MVVYQILLMKDQGVMLINRLVILYCDHGATKSKEVAASLFYVDYSKMNFTMPITRLLSPVCISVDKGFSRLFSEKPGVQD
jgi:hypothetical protein